MKEADAIALIKTGIDTTNLQHWADLGCGSGTFTQALAHLLQQGSTITAIDTQQQKFSPPIHFIQANFETGDLPLSGLDGILMANSFHYIKNKSQLIQKLESYFSASPQFLIVEYDTNNANAWVPFPIPFIELRQLFNQLGYRSVKKLNERRSIYNSASIYATLLSKN